MSILNVKKDKISIGVILAISIAGILYFGYRAIRDNAIKNQPNPFAYDVKSYEASGADLIHYAEVGQISLDLPGVSGIAVGQDNGIYVSGTGSVVVFQSDGTKAHSMSIDRSVR